MVMKPLTHPKFIRMLLVLVCFCLSVSVCVPLLTQAQTNSMFPVSGTTMVISSNTTGIRSTAMTNATVEEKFFMIVNKKSGKALDAGGEGGNVVYPYPTPDRNNNWHLWRLEKVGDYYMVINKQSGKALDAGGEGGNVVYPYPTPDRNNNWHLWRLEKIGDYYMVINKQSGKALDAGGEGGNKVYPYPTPDGNNEWHLWKKVVILPCLLKGDKGDAVGNGRMNTSFTLNCDGSIRAVTRTSTKVKLAGFTGGVVIILLDGDQRPIWASSVHKYGVDGCMIGDCDRTDNWSDTVPPEILSQVEGYAVLQKHQPKWLNLIGERGGQFLGWLNSSEGRSTIGAIVAIATML